MLEQAVLLSFKLNYVSNLPLHLQMAHLIKRAIAEGSLNAREKLPSVRILSKNSGLASAIVERTYRTLAEKGIVEYKKNKGYFLSDNLN